MPPELLPYEDGRWGFRLPLPALWLKQAAGEGVPFVAVDQRDDLPFRSSIVLAVEDLPEGTDLRTWQIGVDQVLPAVLKHYLLLDLEAVTVDGAPAVRRLAHHVAEEGQAVTVEQWATVSAGRGFTLTATCSTLVFDDLADSFAQVAEGFRLPRQGEGKGNR